MDQRRQGRTSKLPAFRHSHPDLGYRRPYHDIRFFWRLLDVCAWRQERCVQNQWPVVRLRSFQFAMGGCFPSLMPAQADDVDAQFLLASGVVMIPAYLVILLPTYVRPNEDELPAGGVSPLNPLGHTNAGYGQIGSGAQSPYSPMYGNKEDSLPGTPTGYAPQAQYAPQPQRPFRQ